MESVLTKIFGSPAYAQALLEHKFVLFVMCLVIAGSSYLLARGIKQVRQDALVGTICLSGAAIMLIGTFFAVIFLAVYGVSLP